MLSEHVISSPVRASLSKLVKLLYKVLDHLVFWKQYNISKSSMQKFEVEEEDYPTHNINFRMPDLLYTTHFILTQSTENSSFLTEL